MKYWIRTRRALPKHGDKVRTRGFDGREFDCEFFHWSEDLKPYFKVIGKVWEHDNVVYWRHLDNEQQPNRC